MGKKVIWSKQALEQTKAIHKYILDTSKSVSIADRVVEILFDSTQILSFQSDLFELDKFKKNNDGSYRAYTKFSYRVSYRIQNDTIRILRIRHTSRDPLEF